MNRESLRRVADEIAKLEKDSQRHQVMIKQNQEQIEELIKKCSLTDLAYIDEYISSKKM